MRIRIHNPIYGVPITFLDKWRPFEPVYILNPDRYANEYIISPNIKPFISVSCLTTTQFRIVGLCNDKRDDNPCFIKCDKYYLDDRHKEFCGCVIKGKATYARIFIQSI